MHDHFKGIKRYVDILNTEKVSNKAWLISTALNKNNFELREVRVYIEGSSYSKCMKEIQGKSILVRVIGSQLYAHHSAKESDQPRPRAFPPLPFSKEKALGRVVQSRVNITQG